LHLLIVSEGLEAAKAPDLHKDIDELACAVLGNNAWEQHVQLRSRDIVLAACVVGNIAFKLSDLEQGAEEAIDRVGANISLKLLEVCVHVVGHVIGNWAGGLLFSDQFVKEKSLVA
jgi:hypothetical protein